MIIRFDRLDAEARSSAMEDIVRSMAVTAAKLEWVRNSTLDAVAASHKVDLTEVWDALGITPDERTEALARETFRRAFGWEMYVYSQAHEEQA